MKPSLSQSVYECSKMMIVPPDQNSTIVPYVTQPLIFRTVPDDDKFIDYETERIDIGKYIIPITRDILIAVRFGFGQKTKVLIYQSTSFFWRDSCMLLQECETFNEALERTAA